VFLICFIFYSTCFIKLGCRSVWATKHPLTNSVGPWFCLSFCTLLFWPCTVLQETSVFNVLKKKVKHNSHAFHYQCFEQTLLHHDLVFNPTNCRNSPSRNMALPTGILSGIEEGGLVFRFIGDTKSKREKFLKSSDRIIQFFVRLHYQAHNQHQTELGRVYLPPYFRPCVHYY
jgi:hypothetical protein